MALIVALIHEEKSCYGISFPDFPGCISGGRTLDEAVRRGADALSFHVEGMIEAGLALPDIRGLDAIRRDRSLAADRKGALMSAVSVEIPSKVERINITIDRRLLDQVDRAAESAGENRSQWLAQAARSRLRPSSVAAAASDLDVNDVVARILGWLGDRGDDDGRSRSSGRASQARDGPREPRQKKFDAGSRRKPRRG